MSACSKLSRGRFLRTPSALQIPAFFRARCRRSFEDQNSFFNVRASFATLHQREMKPRFWARIGLLARVVGLTSTMVLLFGVRKLLQLKEEVPLKEDESRRLVKLMRAAELSGSETSDVVMLGIAQSLFGALQVFRSDSGHISCKDFATTIAEMMETKTGTQLDRNTCELLQAAAWATDRDASGTIELREALSLFVLMLSFRQTGTPKQRADLLFSFADRDCDGYIDPEEMRSWFKSAIAMQLINPQHALHMLPARFLFRPAFWKMGIAGYEGSVAHRLSDNDKEIRRIIDAWCDVLAAQFMQQYDLSADGRLSLDEFVSLESNLDYSVLEAMWKEEENEVSDKTQH